MHDFFRTRRAQRDLRRMSPFCPESELREVSGGDGELLKRGRPQNRSKGLGLRMDHSLPDGPRTWFALTSDKGEGSDERPYTVRSRGLLGLQTASPPPPPSTVIRCDLRPLSRPSIPAKSGPGDRWRRSGRGFGTERRARRRRDG